jgi:hypothetical protein
MLSIAGCVAPPAASPRTSFAVKLSRPLVGSSSISTLGATVVVMRMMRPTDYIQASR